MELFKIICAAPEAGVDASGSIVDTVTGTVGEVLEEVFVVVVSGRADDDTVFAEVETVVVEFAGDGVVDDTVDDVVTGVVFVVDRLVVLSDVDLVVEDEVVEDFVVDSVVVVSLLVGGAVAVGVVIAGVVTAGVAMDDVVAVGVAIDAVVTAGVVIASVVNREVAAVVAEAVVEEDVVGADVVAVGLVVEMGDGVVAL